MKILVTGANGFLGSWICRILSESHEVLALVRTTSSITRLFGIERIQIVRRDEADFHEAIRSYSPQIVILSDWWGVENKFRDDRLQFSNVERFANRIQALNRVERVVGIGSQAELGPRADDIYEDAVDAPTTLYGLAKVEVRKLLQSKLDPQVNFVWCRIFSTYGPLDSDSWLIPNTILKIINGERVKLTKGEQQWSFLHALDLGRAIHTILSNNHLEGVVNIGNPETIRISDVVTLINGYMGDLDLLDFGGIPYRHDQVMRLSPITAKLKDSGWRPQVEIRDGLMSTIDWMLGNSKLDLNLLNGEKISLHLPSYPLMK